MPKALSLKKALNSHSKNQKEITQFFKTQPCSIEKSSPIKNHQDLMKEKVDKKTSKRKAFSPIKLDQVKRKVVSPFKLDHKTKVHKNKVTECDDNSLNQFEINDNQVLFMENKYIENDSNRVKIKFSPNKQFVTKKLFVDIHQEEFILDIKKCNQAKAKDNCKENENNTIGIKSNGAYNIVNKDELDKSPKKSPKGALCVSSKSSTLRIQECDYWSPSKYGSTDKVLEGIENDIDVFDNWEVDIEKDAKENLDLSVIQRCEILSVTSYNCKVELKLKNNHDNIGSCFVEGIWLNTPLEVGDVISVLGTRDPSGSFSVNNSAGLLALRPDHLISSTSVVAGVFCKRKAVLQERWRGMDSANTAMTVGILIHELVQKALTRSIMNTTELTLEVDKIIKNSIAMLYDAGITETEARSNMQMYIQPLSDFMHTYVAKNVQTLQGAKGNWKGKIEEVLDIEENVCCPQLGLKGKIDATLQVTIHERGERQTATVPLELKSGRASVSAEHRGQLILYGMMLSLQRQEDPATAIQRSLLLYLKERIDLREVNCGYPERRDLMMLRNELVQHLAAGPQNIDIDHIVDIEESSRFLQQSLPEPVHHHSACSKCPYLTLCSLHLWHTEGHTISQTHPLFSLQDEALGHLSPQHIKYFLHWTSLLKLEEKGQFSTSPLHALWTESVERRANRGVCAENLKLKSVLITGDKFLHIFERHSTSTDDSKPAKGPQEGEYSIVSLDNRPWIAAGVVTISNNKEFHIILERDLSRRLNKGTRFHIDTYESNVTNVQNLTNLGVLMENSDRALRLRNLIIDKVPPKFVPKLPREVGRLGSKLMRSLNIEQQRAVLKALSCEHYVLLRGLPGTGKTQTISVLIQMLVGLKQRVLVTAHTHSAVDTVLNRLPKSLQIMRLGSASRVAPEVLHRSEHKLTEHCQSTEQLSQIYDSMEVVGVTCLGATHPMLSRITFDVCIVDEATQVLQCTVLRPLFSATRFVLVGDPEQLPPVVKSKSARRLGMEDSLFHRLMKDDSTCTLRLQYRMNQALVDVANKVAYNNSLKCADQRVAQAKLKIDIQNLSEKLVESPWLKIACDPEFENAAIFLNTIISSNEVPSSEKTFTNSDEACVTMQLVETLKQGGVLPSDIGIIAPYRDQVSLLRRAFSGKDVEVSTVDQFQGRDKSVIIYCCTRRYESEDRYPKEGEVLNDQRRLAVSVTRAKHKLIIIGNIRALQRYTSLLKLIESCKTINLERDTMTKLNKKYLNCVT